MEETNTTMNEQQTQQQDATPAGNEGQQQGKTFTQDEVNQIVQNRLERERKTTGEENARGIAETKAAVEARERKLDCKEYLMQNNYPAELLEVIDTSDIEAFKTKAEKAFNAVNGRSRTAPPLRSTEPEGLGGPINKAFDRDTKHKPKYNPYDEYD